MNPVCENVETSEGVPLTVTGVAQVKVITERELLNTACEQFLGKDSQHIQSVVLQTMEGHLRSILGQLQRFRVIMVSPFTITVFTGNVLYVFILFQAH